MLNIIRHQHIFMVRSRSAKQCKLGRVGGQLSCKHFANYDDNSLAQAVERSGLSHRRSWVQVPALAAPVLCCKIDSHQVCSELVSFYLHAFNRIKLIMAPGAHLGLPTLIQQPKYCTHGVIKIYL